jgi:predicted site-specific integrase-resolvase
MKLSEWAKSQGISYRTAHRWFKAGKLPVDSYQSDTSTIIVNPIKTKPISNKLIVIYCRVSSHEKKDDLLRQIDRCLKYSESKGYSITKIYKEIGSGMNDNRTQLIKMLTSKPDIIIVENKDRLTRFGFNYLNTLLNLNNQEIDVINHDEISENDLMKDLISIITSFCCRLYGMRRGYNKAKNIKESIENSNF